MTTQSVSEPVAVGTLTSTNHAAMAMVTTLFFMWGLLTSLNDILVPHLKSIFDLNYAEVILIQFCFFSAYFIFAIPSGKLIEHTGYKRSMTAGLLTMGLGALLFIPAASAPSFPLFLAALIVLAAGMTVLQVSANPYVAVLGPAKTAASRLNLAQAFNSLGTTIAPLLGSLFILSSAPKTSEEMRAMPELARNAFRLHEASSVKLPYLGLALTLILLGVAISKFNLPAFAAVRRGGAAINGVKDSVWNHRRLVLGAIGIFVYVGAEVAIGSFLVNYLSRPEIGGMSVKTAARYVSLYWGGAMIGRFIGSSVLQKLRTGTVLGFAAIAAFALVTTSMLNLGSVAVWSILAIGFFNSVMFPSIFTLSIEGLGALTEAGSGVLVAAIVGGAIIPELQGVFADRIGIHYAFFLPALCYVYIAYFALYGSRTIRSESPSLA
jgi:FHS family L-fucose permease-like MFS transporter